MRIYNLAGLPGEQFTIGFEIAGGLPQAEALYDLRPVKPTVQLTLKDERGRTVIDEIGPLVQWVWSGSRHEQSAFVYRQGASRDKRLPGGGAIVEVIGVKPDGGWGTYFTPRREGKYSLRVAIVQPDSEAKDYRVVLKQLEEVGNSRPTLLQLTRTAATFLVSYTSWVRFAQLSAEPSGGPHS